MLKVILFALLAIGCQCFQEYTEDSIRSYNRVYVQPGVTFPDFHILRGDIEERFTLMLDALAEMSYGLYSTRARDDSNFQIAGEKAYLFAIYFRFRGEHICKVKIEFRSNENEDHYWIVYTTAFTPPTTPSAISHADQFAVRATTLNGAVVNHLSAAPNYQSRTTGFNAEWLVELLSRAPRYRSFDVGIKYYVAVPLIFEEAVLQKLRDLRHELEAAL